MPIRAAAMSGDEIQHLVKMANQIAANIGAGAAQDDTAERVEEHLKRFWARPMRDKLCARLDEYGEQLHPAAASALRRIREERFKP